MLSNLMLTTWKLKLNWKKAEWAGPIELTGDKGKDSRAPACGQPWCWAVLKVTSKSPFTKICYFLREHPHQPATVSQVLAIKVISSASRKVFSGINPHPDLKIPVSLRGDQWPAGKQRSLPWREQDLDSKIRE